MSVTHQNGTNYLKSYSGVLKILEEALHVALIVLSLVLKVTLQSQFFCGISIYGFTSNVVLLAFHLRGIIEKSEFPWFWVECINSALMCFLLLLSSSLIIAVLTKGYIITGIIGYVGVLVYVLDTLEHFNLARRRYAQRSYVWTVPNMPE